ncbi:ATP-binding cassette domain-containing protein, partial [Acinetobacter baumannii]|uniref:ATP-binding cassette domain-containing protein n=1 Tax=Acinetobacter baumannii TaxID=470 RepID=UPI001C092B25
MPADQRIVVRGLGKTFAEAVVAVDGVSFSIAKGEFVALLGPSGCGKSTILNMVAGLIPKSSGEILIDRTP